MRSQTSSFPSSLLLTILFSLSWSASTSSSSSSHEDFTVCLSRHLSHNSTSLSQLIYTPKHPSYKSMLQAYIQNLRLLSPTPHPLAIITPLDESHIQATLHCSTKYNIQIRVRSGGHDFEGLSYVCGTPFILVDLFNLRSITINVGSSTAWVQAGATLGELYYAINNKSSTLAFPGGYWSSVGVGGLISGGGYGSLLRKYGLAADNVVDVRFMDVNGNVLEKKSMNKDLFWAVRGGGGGNFGIVLAWKLELVRVPQIVTYCHVERNLHQNATKLIYKWQYVAPALPKELLLEVRFRSLAVSSSTRRRTILAQFEPIFLGRLEDGLLPLLKERFPELGILKENCTETSWIGVVTHLAKFPSGAPLEILLNRSAPPKACAKQKADYVQVPIPKEGLRGLWKIFHKLDAGAAEMVFTPYGGRMSEISESETPYPHRAGNIFMIYEGVYWDVGKEGGNSTRHLSWMREMRSYMAKYVSKSPRGAYTNYRDLDLGVNDIKGNTSYEKASIWGIQYYKNNFKRLAHVKALIDPGNFFRNAQSIPPLLISK